MTYKTALCSCIVCKKQLSSAGIGSHYTLFHTESKLLEQSIINGKNGSLVSNKILKSKHDQAVTTYMENPNRCKECNSILPYKMKSNSYCSRSCSAKHANRNRPSGHPSRTSGNEGRAKANKKLAAAKPKYTNVSQCKHCKKWFEGIRTICSDACRYAYFSALAKQNPKLGGNKNYRAYGYYDSPIAGKVWLESSYEYRVAVELDANDIRWTRPSYLKYDDKKYFPDFYLVDYDCYLDPKNDYLITQDQAKIKAVIDQNKVKVFILTDKQLSWKAIKDIIGAECRIRTDDGE